MALSVQALFYFWAKRILIGEPLLPYEREQMHPKKSDSEISSDLQ